MAKAGDKKVYADVLIVAGQGVMRALLRDFLQSNFPGLVVAEAGGGNRALNLVRERRPRLILMDTNLPDANGIELTAKIKALLPAVIVIVIANLSGTTYSDIADAAGASAYLTKEKIATELFPLVARALSAASPHDAGGDSE